MTAFLEIFGISRFFVAFDAVAACAFGGMTENGAAAAIPNGASSATLNGASGLKSDRAASAGSGFTFKSAAAISSVMSRALVPEPAAGVASAHVS